MAFDVQKIRLDFPILNQPNQAKVAFFDNASTTFKPRRVVEAMNRYYYTCSVNVGRGDYDLAHQADTMFDEARQRVAKFIQADPREVIFTSGTSMSINLIAYGYGKKFLKEGDEILLTQAEHASNVLPWFAIAKETGAVVNFIPLNEEGRLTADNVKKTMTSKTKIVSIAHVTNVMGFHVDIQSIAKVVHAGGAIILVDGAQSVPHLQTRVHDWDIDFLSFSGHKMCGPTGIGVLFGKYQLLEQMDPFLTGGGIATKFDTCGDITFIKPPHKFEAGTPAIAEAIGLGEACVYLTDIGLSKIEKYEHELRTYAIQHLKKLTNVDLYNPEAESGIITFNIKGVPSQDAATYLNSKGIAVRSGQHCAKILIDYLGVIATIRFSLNFYNTFEEVDRFVEAVKTGGDFLDAYFD
jgi:cysteine desulfurase / selenocysteine lyase